MSGGSTDRRGGRFWLLTAAALLTVALTAALGFWQLGRASQKEALLAQRQARASLPALGWEDLRAADAAQQLAALFERQVRLRGHWLPEATVFLDNRPMEGRAGFIVVTPFQPAGAQAQLVVQRGWVPRRFDDRNALPALATPADEIELEGRLVPPPSKLYEFEPVAAGAIRQNIELKSYAAEWKLKALPVSLQQTGTADGQDGLLRHWPVVGLDVHKHYGYAFQWFGLCALVLVLYVWFQIIVPRRR